jgi:hypothetical protein
MNKRPRKKKERKRGHAPNGRKLRDKNEGGG